MNARKTFLPAAALLAAGCLTLAGCASPPRSTGGETLARIRGALSAAADEQRADPSKADKAAEALLPPLELNLPKVASEVVEPRFDLAVNNAPAAQVFMAIVSGTRYSMLLPPDLRGSVSVSLKNVTVPEALEVLRELYGYDFRIAGTRVFVQPNTLQTRVFQVNYLAGKRQGVSDLRVTTSSISAAQGTTAGGSGTPPAAQPASPAGYPGGSGRVQADSSRVTTASDADFWGDVKTALMAIVGSESGRTVVVNPLSGVVVVRGLPLEIRNAEQYLRATQLVIERQVMLEAKIIEVSLSDEFQAGVNWAAFGGANNRYALGVAARQTILDTVGPLVDPNVAAIPGAGGALATAQAGRGFFGLALQTSNFAGLLNFLESQGSVQVLSSPRIATLNNQMAVLKVGSDEYYVTNVTTNTTTSGTSTTSSPTISLQPFFSGIALDVMPQIDEANNIILHVHPSISVVAEKQKQIDLGSLGQFTLPLAASTVNETDSIVRVQDGNIVAIGGLMKQDQSSDRAQLPGLGDLPLLGGVFGQRGRALRKSELVVLIKPTIIQGVRDWTQDLLDTQARLRDYEPRGDREAP